MSNLDKERKNIQQIEKKGTDMMNKCKSKGESLENLSHEVKLANDIINDLNKHTKKCPELKNTDSYQQAIAKFTQFKEAAEQKLQQKKAS